MFKVAAAELRLGEDLVITESVEMHGSYCKMYNIVNSLLSVGSLICLFSHAQLRHESPYCWGSHPHCCILCAKTCTPQRAHLSVSVLCLYLCSLTSNHQDFPPHSCLSSSKLLMGSSQKNIAQTIIHLQCHRGLKFDCCGNSSGFVVFKFSATIPC